MTHSTLCGYIPLIDIHKESLAASDKVTRWCPNCGAVVVDEDVEGNVRPGAYQKMVFPRFVGEKLAMKLLNKEIPIEDLDTPDRELLVEGLERGQNERDRSIGIPVGDDDGHVG